MLNYQRVIDSMFHFSQCSGYAVRQLGDDAAHSWWSMMWCSILKDSSQPIDYVETCKRYVFFSSFKETTHLFDERIHASILDRFDVHLSS